MASACCLKCLNECKQRPVSAYLTGPPPHVSETQPSPKRVTFPEFSRYRLHMKHTRISPRILRFVEALPLSDSLRVLEIGCGPGVASRAMARRVGRGFAVAIARSQRAIEIAKRGSADEIAAGTLAFHCAAAEDFVLSEGEPPFDGRHHEAGLKAMERLRRVLAPHARFFIDTTDPLYEVSL